MAIWKRLHLLLPHFSLLLLLLLLSLLPLLLFALCCYVFVCWQFTAREMVAQNSLLESFDTGEVIWVDIERFDIYPYVNISLSPTASGDTIVASAFCFDFAVVCAVVVFFGMSVLLLGNSYIPRFVADFVFSSLLRYASFFSQYFCSQQTIVCVVFLVAFAYFRFEYVLSITRGFTCHKRCRTLNILKVNVNVFAVKLCKFY